MSTIAEGTSLAFLHFTKTALVTERDEATNQYKRVVRKIGLDPHFSYANMLCDVAMARVHGTTRIFTPKALNSQPERTIESLEQSLPGAPTEILNAMVGLPPGLVCGRCDAFPLGNGDEPIANGRCSENHLTVAAQDRGCYLFVAVES